MTALDYILSRYQMPKYEKAPKERAVLNPNRSLGFLYVVRQREILMTDLGLFVLAISMGLTTDSCRRGSEVAVFQLEQVVDRLSKDF